MRGPAPEWLPTPVRPSAVERASASAVRLPAAVPRRVRALVVSKAIDGALALAVQGQSRATPSGGDIGNAPPAPAALHQQLARVTPDGRKPHRLASARSALSLAAGCRRHRGGRAPCSSRTHPGRRQPAKDGDGPHAVVHHCGTPAAQTVGVTEFVKAHAPAGDDRCAARGQATPAAAVRALHGGLRGVGSARWCVLHLAQLKHRHAVHVGGGRVVVAQCASSASACRRRARGRSRPPRALAMPMPVRKRLASIAGGAARTGSAQNYLVVSA